MLSATLRQLERDGLVERQSIARVPARVEYELSPVGEHLLAALVPLAGWGLEHQRDVNDAREHFDRLQHWRSQGEEITRALGEHAAHRVAAQVEPPVVASASGSRCPVGHCGLVRPEEPEAELRRQMHVRRARCRPPGRRRT